MPSFPKFYTGNPFTSEGDVYAECGVEGCKVYGGQPFHTMGPRATVKKIMADHHRLCHVQETAVIKLNQRKH